jgi:Tol biopolymer transport system component
MRLDVGAPTPLQLTMDDAQNYDPALTADGQRVLYTSSRNPPGIYRVPVAGGASELVIEHGLAPKISPDGKLLLYGSALALLKRPVDGGPSSPVLAAAKNSYAPAWSPDGSQIMVTAKDVPDDDPQWWIGPLAGGELRKTAIIPELHQQGFTSAFLNAWLPDDWIVFSGIRGETMTLWKIKLDRDTVPGQAQRATLDAEGDYGATYACGKLVYSRTRVDMNFWALPLDETGLHLKGPPLTLTSGSARKGQQSVAGSKLLYSAENSRGFSLALKDLASGSEKQLKDGFFALLSPDGSHYVYGGSGTYQDLSLLTSSTSWWPFWSSSVCEHCGMPRGFSPDGKRLLLLTNAAEISRLTILDLRNGQSTELISSPEVLTSPNLSADGNWVTFVARVGQHNWQTFVVPMSAPKTLSSSEWIPVMPVSDSFHFAFWSERGDLIYNLTARGGSGNLKWLEAQPVDKETKHPTGVPTEVYEFSDMLVPGMDPNWNTITAAGGRIVLELGDVSTNIWAKNLK